MLAFPVLVASAINRCIHLAQGLVSGFEEKQLAFPLEGSGAIALLRTNSHDPERCQTFQIP